MLIARQNVISIYSQSSVGVNMTVNYAQDVSTQIATDSEKEIDAYLNGQKWLLVGDDGTKYPVKNYQLSAESGPSKCV